MRLRAREEVTPRSRPPGSISVPLSRYYFLNSPATLAAQTYIQQAASLPKPLESALISGLSLGCSPASFVPGRYHICVVPPLHHGSRISIGYRAASQPLAIVHTAWHSASTAGGDPIPTHNAWCASDSATLRLPSIWWAISPATPAELWIRTPEHGGSTGSRPCWQTSWRQWVLLRPPCRLPECPRVPATPTRRTARPAIPPGLQIHHAAVATTFHQPNPRRSTSRPS